MAKVKLTVLESRCRGGYHKKGQVYWVEDLCPPICHELWNCIYPMVYVLQNGGTLDAGTERATYFELRCPDGGRVFIRGEAVEAESVIGPKQDVDSSGSPAK